MTNVLGEIRFVPPEGLIPHPINKELYGDVVDEEFIKSVATGLVEPVVATSDLTIISGHRRVIAAASLEWDLIPTVIRADLTDPLDIEEALILANRQRDKTNEQKAREYKRLKEIEHARAHKGGRGQSKKKTLDSSSPEYRERGDAKAAKAAGFGRTTAQRAEKVVEAIDTAKAEGNTDKAEHLSKQLNSNVAKAHRSVTAPASPDSLKVPAALVATFDSNATFKSLAQRIGLLRKDIFELSEEPGGERLPLTQIRVDLNNVSEALQSAKPHSACPYCKGAGCKQCDALGWMHKDRYAGIPEERR
jgi:ParB-like chromosome segregation protein Spo0J